MPRDSASKAPTRLRSILSTALGIVLIVSLEREASGAQESEHYRIDGLSVCGVGEQAGSAQFDLLATVAETEPVGTTSFCNGGYAASLGSLSIFGEAPVANLLFVDRSQANPAHLELAVIRSVIPPPVSTHHPGYGITITEP